MAKPISFASSNPAASFQTQSTATGPTDSVAGLLQLANQQGGSIAEAANELAHPHTSILSTIGDTFKNAFSGFVDLISMPAEVVAGAIDPNMSVADAIKTHERVSDVVFGKRNPNATTVRKVGDFFVRTATDILTDPLTYVTFGSSAGIFGLKALPEVSLGLGASKELGLIKDGEALTQVFTKAISEPGTDVLKYAQLLVKQATGKLGLDESIAKFAGKTGELGTKMADEVGALTKNATAEAAAKAGITDFEGQAYKDLMKATLESPLNIDFAKKAFSNLLENNPGLASTLIDKGGIKAFGQTIISGQRIGSALQFIPGMTAIDELTKPTRMALGALFNPAIIKTATQGYQRIPEEMVTLMQAARDFKDVTGNDALKTMSDLLRENQVTAPELTQVMTALSTRKVPADPKLANLYLRMMDMNAASKKFVEARGGHIGTMENHIGLVLNPTDVKKVSYAGKASGNIGAAAVAGNAKFVAQVGQDVAKEVPQIEKVVSSLPGGKALLSDISQAGSVQDVGYAMGRHTDEYIQHLLSSGQSMEQVLQDKGVQDLIKLRQQVDQLPHAEELIGPAGAARDAAGNTKFLTQKLTSEETDKIIKGITDYTEKAQGKISGLRGEVEQLAGIVQDIFRSRVASETEHIITKGGKAVNEGRLLGDGKNMASFMRSAGVDAENVKQFVNVVMGQTSEVDVAKLAKQYAATKAAKEFSMKEIRDMSPDALKKLMKNIMTGMQKLPDDMQAFEAAIKEASEKEATAAKAAGGTGTGELAELAKKLKLRSSALRFQYLNENGNKDAIAQFINGLKTAFENDPQGAGRALTSILGKNQKIEELLKNVEIETTAAKQKLSNLPQLDRFFQDNEGTIFKRVATTADELKSVGIEGFDTNLATSMATRFLQNINQGISLEFVNNLGKNFGMKASEAPTGWLPLGIAKANEAADALLSAGGEQILYHPTIAAAAEDMFKSLTSDPATGDFLKFYDKLQAYWKGSVTSIFPQFHGRNAVSNVLLNFLDLGYHAFNPATHTAAADLLMKDRQANSLAKAMLGTGERAIQAQNKFNDLMATKVFTDVTGADYTFGEIRSAVKQHNVAMRSDIGGQADVYGERERLFTSLSGITDGKVLGKQVGNKTKKVVEAVNPFTLDPGNFAPIKFGRAVGNTIESQARLVNFLSNLRATGDVIHAAQRTKMFLFDYQNLSNFERGFMRRVIPFYTFTRKNLELQAKTLMTTPGRIAGELTALSTLGETLSGGHGLTDEEKAALPDWVKSGIGVLAERKGSTVSLLTGFGTPIEQPFAAFQPNQLLGSVSPLLRVPVEQASGYSFFQGKMLSDVTNAAGYKDAPEAVKNLIGYTELKGKKSDGSPFTWYVALNPSAMNLVNNLPFTGRVLSALKQMQTEDVSTQYKILQQTVGVRPYSFDVQQEQEKREREMKSQLQELLTKAGVTAQFTKTFVPKK